MNSTTTELNGPLQMEIDSAESNADTSGETIEKQPNPFDDPVQRTKCLIQYIRLRKQRAEAEQAKRSALRKQKMDEHAKLQSAREEKSSAEAEELEQSRKIDTLNQQRHQVVTTLKTITAREAERKKKREEQERHQRVLAAAAAAEEQRRLTQQQQSMAQDYYNQQLRNTINTLLGSPGTALGTGVHSLISQLLLPSPTATTTTGTSLPSSSSLMAAAVAAQQQRQLNTYGLAPSTNQQSASSQSQLHNQQQQIQNAVSQLLRNFPNTASVGVGSSMGTTISPSLAHFQTSAPQQQLDLQTQLSAATAQQVQIPSYPSNLNIQALAAAAATGLGGSEILPSQVNAATAGLNASAGISPDILYSLLLAGNAGINPAALTSHLANVKDLNKPK